MHALALVAAAALAAAPATAPPVVAVWEVKASEGVTEATAAIVTDMVAQELAATGRVKVLTRNDAVAVLGFQKYRQALGCLDQGCMATAGGSLGADHVLSGTLARLGAQYRLSVLVVDAKKGEALVREAELCAGDEGLAAATRAVVGRVANAFPAPGSAGALAAIGAGPGAAAKLLATADGLAAQKRHAEAAAAYEDYLRRFPQGEDRCRAMASAGGQRERTGEGEAAAGHLSRLGGDAACAGANPNGAALALDRAATLYERAGREGDATAMREALVKLPGVTSSDARNRVEGARARLEVGAALDGKR